jgi:hypothetical protein
MPKKRRKPHVADTLHTIDAAIDLAIKLGCETPENQALVKVCAAGLVDLARAKTFIENLSDWGKF